MKKKMRKENNTMDQSDVISDPFFDSLKKQLDESLDLEDILVSEELIQSTLRAIEVKKETTLHENDCLSTEEKNINLIEQEKQALKEKQGKNKRKNIKYIGAWGTVAAASIIICYLGGRGLLSNFVGSKLDSNTSGSRYTNESIVMFDSVHKDGENPENSGKGMLNESANDGSPAEENKSSSQEEPGSNVSGGTQKEGESREESQAIGDKVTLTTQDALEGNADMKINHKDDTNTNADGVSIKAYDYAIEDINLWTDASTINITLESQEEEQVKDIMLLMPSEHLHLTTEDPKGVMKYIICISLTEDDVIVYFLNDTEVLIKTYGKEGIITSTSYEVDETYDLIQDIENIIK